MAGGSATLVWGGVFMFLAFVYQVLSGWLAAVLAPLAFYVGILLGKTGGKKNSKRMSFVSEALARGAFPPEAKIPEPIMHAIMWFDQDQQPQASAIAQLFKDVMHKPAYVKLHSVLREHRGEIEFKEIPLNEFDLNRRIKEKSGFRSENEIVEFVQSLMLENMDISEPLWDIYILSNSGEGRCAVVPKIHHAVGDGLSMLGLFMNFFKNADGTPVKMAAIKSPVTSKDQKKQKIDYFALAKKFFAALGKVLSIPNSPWDTVTKLKDPSSSKVFSGYRRLVISPPIDLNLIKEIKNATKTTVNDVCVAALTGAIRRYLEVSNDPSLTKPMQLRSLLPYGFPRITDPSRVYNALINWWVLVSLELPIQFHSKQPLERLREVKKRCDDLKSSPEAIIQYYVQVLANKILPFELQRKTNLETILRHTCVFTNVPGPDSVVYFAGKKVDFIDTVVVNCLPQISALSYNGKISMTYVIDDKISSGADKLPQYFLEELEAIKKALP